MDGELETATRLEQPSQTLPEDTLPDGQGHCLETQSGRCDAAQAGPAGSEEAPLLVPKGPGQAQALVSFQEFPPSETGSSHLETPSPTSIAASTIAESPKWDMLSPAEKNAMTQFAKAKQLDLSEFSFEVLSF